MKLSILMPVYNEINTLEKIISSINAVPVDKEIIVVDDYSTDGSRELLKGYSRKNSGNLKISFHDKNTGKGSAIKTALKHAKGEYSIIQDGDLEYDPQDYKPLIDKAESGNLDAVYGSRFMNSRRVTSFWHFAVNRFLTLVTNLLFGSRLTDMETCYKMLRTGVFRGLEIESERFEIEPEITAKLLKNGYKIREVPISYKGRSYHEGKKITWRDGIITLSVLLKYRFFR